MILKIILLGIIINWITIIPFIINNFIKHKNDYFNDFKKDLRSIILITFIPFIYLIVVLIYYTSYFHTEYKSKRRK